MDKSYNLNALGLVNIAKNISVVARRDGYNQSPQSNSIFHIFGKSVDLVYSLNLDQSSYTVTGIVAGNNGSVLSIPGQYESLPVTAIAPSAFANTGVEYVVIGDNVTTIGNGAFDGCTELKTLRIEARDLEDASANNYIFRGVHDVDIVIGVGVNRIPAYLFCPGGKNEAMSISSLTFDLNSVCYEIGAHAFEYARTISSVSIRDNMASIGEYAFASCPNLTNLRIDAVLNTIGENAFYNCASLNYVILSNIELIGDGMFKECISLASITIPDSAEYIGAEAFMDATNLESVNFRDGVKDIRESAFSGCDKLKNISIPENVELIGDYAFNSCTSLRNVSIYGAREIGIEAFFGCASLQYVRIPSTVTSIGDSAFAACDNLTMVKYTALPEAWAIIGAYSDIDPSIIVYGTDGLTYSTSSGEASCTGLNPTSVTEIIISPQFNGMPVTLIANNAFASKEQIISVIIPSPVEEIGSGAFAGCTSLKSITISNSVTEIGDNAFSGCIGMTDVYYGGSEAEWNQIVIGTNNSYLTDATIHYYALGTAGLAYSLNQDTASYTVTGIGTATDTDIVIPSEYGGIPVTAIADNAFYTNRNITSIRILDGVKSIGANAFNWCDKITSVYIPKSIEIIGADAFYAVNASTYITDIAAWCNITFGTNQSKPAGFYYLNNVLIEDLVIPDDVTTVNAHAFESVNSIKSIVIGEGVKTIGSRAFAWLEDLSSITFNAIAMDDPGSSDSIFRDNGTDGTTITLSIGPNVTRIPKLLMQGNKSLEHLFFNKPSACSEIGWSAFADCTLLTEVTIPDSINYIDSYAFGRSGLDYAYFNTTGWLAGTTSVDLSNAATAAEYLTTTYSSRVFSRG